MNSQEHGLLSYTHEGGILTLLTQTEGKPIVMFSFTIRLKGMTRHWSHLFN